MAHILCNSVGARGGSSVRYGTRLGDLKNKQSTERVTIIFIGKKKIRKCNAIVLMQARDTLAKNTSSTARAGKARSCRQTGAQTLCRPCAFPCPMVDGRASKASKISCLDVSGVLVSFSFEAHPLQGHGLRVVQSPLNPVQ